MMVPSFLSPRQPGNHVTGIPSFPHWISFFCMLALTAGLLGMLQVIAANPGLAQSRLAEAMEVDRSTIVKVVDQLEGRGLIVREPSPHDKRSYCLRLTGEGTAALRRMLALMRRHEDEFTQALSDEERQLLIRLLERLHSPAAPSPDRQAPR